MNNHAAVGEPIIIKFFAGACLLLLWSAIIWTLTHLRKIKRYLAQNEALPDSTPRLNIEIYLCLVSVAITALMSYLIFG